MSSQQQEKLPFKSALLMMFFLIGDIFLNGIQRRLIHKFCKFSVAPLVLDVFFGYGT
jgi:hypothetical protein